MEMIKKEKRYGLIRNFAERNGFRCEERLSQRVSHLVTDLKDLEQLCRLYPSLPSFPDTQVVSSQWLYARVRQKTQVPESDYLIPGYSEWRTKVTPRATFKNIPGVSADASHHTKQQQQQQRFHTSVFPPIDGFSFDKDFFNNNPLERHASLDHHNPELVAPLSFLSEYWSTMGDEQRSLAFATAAATLKSLPFAVTTMSQIVDLKGLGSGHCLKVLQETLDTGSCREVVAKRDSDKYKSIKSLTGVYGIGNSVAEKLYTSRNITRVSDIIASWGCLALHDERIKYGVAYYGDLNTPVTREAAERIQGVVRRELDQVAQGCKLELTGGYRRGKSSGHDVDLLVCCGSNDEDGASVSSVRSAGVVGSGGNAGTDGVLARLLRRLRHTGLILHARLDRPPALNEAAYRKQSDRVSSMDNYEKCFCILKCPLQDDWTPDPMDDIQTDLSSLVTSGQNGDRGWRATRVDLVYVPQHQWPYAVLGWSGSKLFLRLLRRYASSTLGLVLTSHGLWSKDRGRLLPANSEQEIFAHLGLTYKHPSQRNF
ncbi:hypothetical protein Pcinc_039509 [Petrolisthes cinctipes]|uniref:BRCT domain-containing protein n=1 Tax=Petrolisthes cinctipes TaxID=88211 RepID=A0AAE1BNE9_PETCI|nr:hypothetical protein Pcinc_039509 [Petrolisthes cinctipes]